MQYDYEHIWHSTGEGYVVIEMRDGHYRRMGAEEVCDRLVYLGQRIEDLEGRLEHEIQHGAACTCIECRIPGAGDIDAR